MGSEGGPEGSRGQPEVSEGKLKGSEDQTIGYAGQPRGIEFLPIGAAEQKNILQRHRGYVLDVTFSHISSLHAFLETMRGKIAQFRLENLVYITGQTRKTYRAKDSIQRYENHLMKRVRRSAKRQLFYLSLRNGRAM